MVLAIQDATINQGLPDQLGYGQLSLVCNLCQSPEALIDASGAEHLY